LGLDRSSCGPLLLQANHPAHLYRWSTGDSVANIIAKSTGNYSLRVTHPQTGCADSADVWLVIHPTVQLNLGNGTAVCANSGFELNTGNPSSTAKWSTGAGGAVLSINTSGVYGVTVTNYGGCSATDYINVTVKPLPVV